jgi:hypothetical protein
MTTEDAPDTDHPAEPQTPRPVVEWVSMVYDADGGLRGELAYVVGKLRGAHCALCDITHSAVRAKPAFVELTCSLPVPVDVLHRNEQAPELAAFTAGIEPVVVAHTDGGLEVLMDADALDGCHGSVEAFGRELLGRLEGRTPTGGTPEGSRQVRPPA